MSSFFNFLKGLFSGIFSFLGGLLGSKQSNQASLEGQPKTRRDPKSKYFLELDEAKDLIPDSAKPTAKEEAPQAVATESQSASKAELTKSAPAAVGPTKADPQPAPTAKSAPAKAPEPAAVANTLNLPQPSVTFAPEYLAPTASSNGRRRPGANMAAYLDMARQVKTPG